MKFSFFALLPLSVAFFVGCANSTTYLDERADAMTEIVEPEPVRRYGIEIEGYTITDHVIEFGRTMSEIVTSNGGSAMDVDRMDRASREVFPLKKMRAGNHYSTFVAEDSLAGNRLDYIVYEANTVDYVVFKLMADSVAVYTGSKPLQVQRHMKSAEIESSMWGAIMEAELPYALGAELEDVYQWTIDFFGIQAGDNFTVIYDEKFVDDTISVGVGQIWGVRFTHSGITNYAIPFKQGDKIAFWEEDGASLRKTMLKAPLKYSRISSKFSNSRLHPIYKVYRPHHGVDYAAPLGTPVYAVSDGVVTRKWWDNGGGNSLKIKHAQKMETGYLHLSRYAQGIAEGVHVKQGDLIGYVGSTGASTGPHLDFRVWRNGVAIDPLKIPQTPTEPISDDNREAFEFVKGRIMAELNGELSSDDLMIADLDNIPVFGRDSVTVGEV